MSVWAVDNSGSLRLPACDRSNRKSASRCERGYPCESAISTVYIYKPGVRVANMNGYSVGREIVSAGKRFCNYPHISST
jgi:hypothetical protein